MTCANAMAEAFAVADAASVERSSLYDVMAAGPNHSGMMDFIKNYAMAGRIDLAFSVANGAKDVGYYQKMAEDMGLTSRMSGAAATTLKEALAKGSGDLMVPQMVDWFTENLDKTP